MATTPNVDQAASELLTEAADEANRSGPLVDAVDAVRAALAALVEGVADHNARVSRWHTAARNAGAPDRTTPRDGATPPPAVTHGQDGAIVVDGREFRPLDSATLIDVIVHQVIRPDEPRTFDHVHAWDWDVTGHVRGAAGD